MKKIILLIIIIILTISCSNQSQQPKTSAQPNCKTYFSYGGKRFCLPILEGMTECMSNSIIKEWSQKLQVPNTKQLAIYIRNDFYENLKNLENEIVDDYFILTAFTNLEGQNISKSQFKTLSTAMEGNVMKGIWEDVKNNIEEIGVDSKIDQPVLLEAYSPQENVKSMIMFVRYINDTGEYYSINVSNLLFIDKSLFMLNYIKNYNGEESITQARIKNNFIILRFIEENK